MMDPQAQAEKAKYDRAYRSNEYRERSPGARVAPLVYTAFGMQDADSLTDYGCGTGRAALWFYRRLIAVQLIDFSQEYLDTECWTLAQISRETFSFLEGNLWEMKPRIRPTTFGFCCDVLEHIPEEKVEPIVAIVRDFSIKAAFFKVANHASFCGDDDLHITRKPFAWWRDLFTRNFAACEFRPGDRPDTMEIYAWKTFRSSP